MPSVTILYYINVFFLCNVGYTICEKLICSLFLLVILSCYTAKVELIEADTSDFTVKMRNLAEGTERDVVRFFAKRIKCGCLKSRSRKIKNEPKCK